jgi:DNA modification methylase
VRAYLDGKIAVHAGDCLKVIRTLADNSIDSCVTDPPYALVSITKRFGKDGAAAPVAGVYRRSTSGFMGKQWDTGDVAFSVELWAEVFRVLKPGGHVLAFGGTRTQHRLVCAIEDAGFEIRDTIMWVYSQGFPKSHDQGNGLGTALKPAHEPICVARKPLSEPTVAANVLKWSTGALNIDACRVPSSTGQRPNGEEEWASDQSLCVSCAEHVGKNGKNGAQAIKAFTATKLVAPATSAKEEISLIASKQNTDIGCSAGTKVDDTSTSLNIGECGRTQTVLSPTATNSTTSMKTRATTDSRICSACGATITLSSTGSTIAEKRSLPRDGSRPVQAERADGLTPHGSKRNDSEASTKTAELAPRGRFPANLIHDGSDEVVGCFPETSSVTGKRTERSQNAAVVGTTWLSDNHKSVEHTDSGSPARFFYSAKADSDDRLGSSHPTVKPVDLMQWLVRLVTPKGGLVLDPFAGTGTTGEAAFREGCRAILIEREPEYLADIERRCSLILSGPTGRRHATIKAKGKIEKPGGLFG